MMKKQNVLSDQRFILTTSFMVVFCILVTVSRLLLADNSQIITVINDAAAVFCVLAATIFFIVVWASTSSNDISKRIWGQLVVGMIAWTVAEITWAFYEVILGQEVPYPSIADLFWLFGYVIFYVALVNQYRLFQTTPSQQQKTVTAILVVLFSLLVGVLVLEPIAVSFDSQKLLESLLNLAYPLADLVLLILTLAIIFSLEQGRFALTWRIVGLGLVFMSLGDLMFSYASWNEFYFPDSQLNGITLLIDSLYYVGYLTLGLGAYTYKLTSDLLQPVRMEIVLRSLTRSNILIFIGADGRIISLSDNFSNLVRSESTEQYINMMLSEVLKIDPAHLRNLLQKTLAQGSLSTQSLQIQDSRGGLRNSWITSLAIYDDQKHLVCIAIVLRANLDSENGPERPLKEEQQLLIQYYLTQAGTYQSEENQIIKEYFLAQVRLLYSLVQQFSGISVAEKLLTYLNQVTAQNGWHFTFSEQEIGIPEEYEGELLAGCLSRLLAEAKSFAVNMINLKVVEQEMKLLDNNLSSDNLRYIDKYDLRRVRIASS
jgi:hypothetical protein